MWNRLKWSGYLAWQMRGQARLPFKPLETLRRIQGRRVRAMVAHACRTVPYYRETMDQLGLTAGDFRTADDLARLPVIEPEQLQRDPHRFVSTAQPLDRCLRLFTGGSTGDPRPVYHTAGAILQNAAHGERERCMLTRLIGERFGIPVFSTYEAIEALKIGFECESHRGLHLNIDFCPVRIVDASGQDLPAGRTGEVVISNLVNPGTVLLNYRLGDLAGWLEGPCPCGRSLPMISFLPGRSDDLIQLASGQMVHPDIIRTIFTNEEQVWQFQVVQDSTTHFTVKVVPSRSADRAALRDRLASGFAQRFGKDARADIAFVDRIERTAGGKFRPVISLCRGAQPGAETSGG